MIVLACALLALGSFVYVFAPVRADIDAHLTAVRADALGLRQLVVSGFTG